MTTFDRTQVIVDWIAPSDQGSEITAYKVLIRQSDLMTYSLELIDCDGSSQAIVDATECSISISLLRGSPFNLDWGAEVHA